MTNQRACATIGSKNEKRGARLQAAERSFELKPFALGQEPDPDNAGGGSVFIAGGLCGPALLEGFHGCPVFSGQPFFCSTDFSIHLF